MSQPRDHSTVVSYYLFMSRNSNIRQQIIDNIFDNTDMYITGDRLQDVLLLMFDRDVFLTQAQYDNLVEYGLVDVDKIYHIYEE